MAEHPIFSASFHTSTEAADYLQQIARINGYEAAMLSVLDPKPGETLLDVGFGEGTFALNMKKLGLSVYGIDNDSEMLEKSKLNIPGLAVNADASFLPLPNNYFDKVLLQRSLQWFEYQETALSEGYRVLTSGGKLVVVEVDWAGVEVDHPDKVLTSKIISPKFMPMTHKDTAPRIGTLFQNARIPNMEIITKTDFLPAKAGYQVLKVNKLADMAQERGVFKEQTREKWESVFLEKENQFIVKIPVVVASSVKV